MSEKELRPCPFCGQTPKVTREYHEKWKRDSESGKMILHVLPEFDDWVGCDNKECFIHYNQIEEPPVERLENWNIRPIEDELCKRIVELSQALGLITTLKPTMVMDVDHPLDMEKEVEAYVTARIAELEAEAKRRDEFAECLGAKMADVYVLKSRIAELEKENDALKNVPIPIEYWSEEKKEIYRRNESRSIKSGREE